MDARRVKTRVGIGRGGSIVGRFLGVDRLQGRDQALHLAFEPFGAFFQDVCPRVGLGELLIQRVEEVPLSHELEFELCNAVVGHVPKILLRGDRVNQSFVDGEVVCASMRCWNREMRGEERGSWTLIALLVAGCAGAPVADEASAAPTSRARAPRPARSPCPETPALVAKWVARMGGAEALRKASQGFRAAARVDGDPGPAGNLRIYFQAPQRVRSILELDSGERFEDGVDGDLAWSRGPDGIQVHRGAAAASALRRADLFGMALRYADRFPSSRCVGADRLDGHSVWIIEAQTADGEDQTHVFDAESGRLLGLRIEAQTRLGPVRIQTRFDDFRLSGSLELPFEQIHRAEDMEQRVIFERFVFVPPIEEEVAAPPEVTRWARSQGAVGWPGPAGAARRP